MRKIVFMDIKRRFNHMEGEEYLKTIMLIMPLIFDIVEIELNNLAL